MKISAAKLRPPAWLSLEVWQRGSVLGAGGACWPAAIPWRCSQRPPLRLGHGQRAGEVQRSPHKVRLVPRAPHPAGARGRGARSSQAAPPALAPLAPATGRSPPPRLQKLRAPACSTGFVPQPVPAAPTLRLLRTTSAIAFVAFRSDQPLLRRGRGGCAAVKASSP